MGMLTMLPTSVAIRRAIPVPEDNPSLVKEILIISKRISRKIIGSTISIGRNNARQPILSYGGVIICITPLRIIITAITASSKLAICDAALRPGSRMTRATLFA